jgi:hypothetical protein
MPAGWVSGKGRVPYILLSLMDVIREYGDEVRLRRRRHPPHPLGTVPPHPFIKCVLSEAVNKKADTPDTLASGAGA